MWVHAELPCVRAITQARTFRSDAATICNLARWKLEHRVLAALGAVPDDGLEHCEYVSMWLERCEYVGFLNLRRPYTY